MEYFDKIVKLSTFLFDVRQVIQVIFSGIKCFVQSIRVSWNTKFEYLYHFSDTDECYNYNGNCTHFCDNLKGSYKCRCRDGYRLKSDQHSCGGKIP